MPEPFQKAHSEQYRDQHERIFGKRKLPHGSDKKKWADNGIGAARVNSEKVQREVER